MIRNKNECILLSDHLAQIARKDAKIEYLEKVITSIVAIVSWATKWEIPFTITVKEAGDE